jgi:hypothetical protein
MFFPYEEYICSSNESEWRDDVKRRNNIVKYVNILTSDNGDYSSFYKFCNSAIFFRNVFCKESFIYFFLNKFDESERKLLARAVFDMFVKSGQGQVGDHYKHFKLSVELSKDITDNQPIDRNYEKICTEIDIF